MTRRRLLLLALPVALVLLGVSGWALWPRPSAITRENFKKIEPGMTLAEVEAILGGPARSETWGAEAGWTYSWHSRLFVGDGLDELYDWIGPEYAVQVGFHDGRVVAYRTGRLRGPTEETLLEHICRWGSACSAGQRD
jgi:SmpA / OmlA family